jgi:hypothetical protein
MDRVVSQSVQVIMRGENGHLIEVELQDVERAIDNEQGVEFLLTDGEYSFFTWHSLAAYHMRYREVE